MSITNEVKTSGENFQLDQTPKSVLEENAAAFNCKVTDIKFANEMDHYDPLKTFRDKFHYPKCKDLHAIDPELITEDEDAMYFSGNSLGLQPKKTSFYIQRELDKWAKCGVEGHVRGDLPWVKCDDYVKVQSAKLVGAEPDEVAIMNGLTVNIHILLTAFYKPTHERYKIMFENKAFPSDHYAIESQIKINGFDPKTSMILVKPREGEHVIRSEDISKIIAEEGSSIALIFFSGVHYYTGHLFDMKHITDEGHKKGCVVGFDLAHAIGNVEIKLHEWDVDFAVWCSYKYLNAGCGGIAGTFIHNKYITENRPHLIGWWGDNLENRFKMNNDLHLLPGIEGYRLSNPPVLLVCPLLASLDIFEETSIKDLTQKQFLLTGYLEYLLLHYFSKYNSRIMFSFCILTSPDPKQRGNQLSITFSQSCSEIFDEITKRGVVCDFREPDVIRIAPCPLYNSFFDVYRLVNVLKFVVENCIEKDHG